MSTDPKAILYYGFPLTENNEDFDEDGYDDKDWYEINDEWEKSHRPKQPETQDYKAPEWDTWRASNLIWMKTVENIRVDWSGAESCERHYVSCLGLEMSVEWSDQLKIEPSMLETNPEADEWICKFCEHAGIEFRQPGWYLASRYF